MPEPVTDYDFVIVGSGFGGSVAALRLVQKGYRVLVLEKGAELGADQFPKSNWDLRRYMWLPLLGFRGLFNMTFFRHVTILSGVGVGGGSLVYACTHPVPRDSFFTSKSWAHLADWKRELAPHYAEAKRMLGVTETPFRTRTDDVLHEIATERGDPGAFEPTDVAIYFGKPGQTVPDPYFGGRGPERTGCIRCGGCMLGCRHGAKNSLDRNYLWLARAEGLELRADTEVTAVRPLPDGGYRIEGRHGRMPWFRTPVAVTAANVIFAGGVLGTVALLLAMKEDPRGLPNLSNRLGYAVRTNSEALIGVVSRRRDVDLSRGIAIGSILQTDEHSHLEPVRYSAGSGFFRILIAPHVGAGSAVVRLYRLVATMLRHPLRVLRALTVSDLAKQSTILLYMRTTDGTLRLRRNWIGRMSTARDEGQAPTASIPEATALARKVGDKLDGLPFSLVTETIFDIPTTAHILGGCCMGTDASEGVIDRFHRVFGYEGLYVMDGSAISANPGVNPSLTITAMAERAVAAIPDKLRTGLRAVDGVAAEPLEGARA
ncbi:MAG TPA: GMC family oxidoreductase [Nannocystaceae bacterium]|nr:GMC family oxidoreductase [Nannocystaceae bacterium]